LALEMTTEELVGAIKGLRVGDRTMGPVVAWEPSLRARVRIGGPEEVEEVEEVELEADDVLESEEVVGVV
jgi:hypothetical protein